MPKELIHSPTDLAKSMDELSDDIPMPGDLTERQRRIVKYRLRGMTQRAIARLEDVSQPMIAKEMRAIRAAFKEQGENIDQDVIVGESMTLYQELEQRAWEIYHKALDEKKYGDCNKALATIMSARDHTVKLLLDLGLVERAKIEHSHTVNLPPFVEKWKEVDKSQVITSVIHTQLDPLEDPEPPQLAAEYAEYEEYSEDVDDDAQ